MATVLVVTDSSACLPSEVVSSLGIRVLPISVHLPEGDVAEGADGVVVERPLPEELEMDELAGANHPLVTEYLEAIESPDHDTAVVITPAIEFATMHRNASVAAELAERRAVVVDSRTAAAGQALVVLAAAEAAKAGADIDGVLDAVKDASTRVEVVASLANLDALRRVGPVAESLLVGNETEGTRSVFRMHQGEITSVADTTSAAGALASIVQVVGRSARRAVVFHAGAPALAEELSTLLGGVEFVSGFSLAMQIHTGPGVVGAAWLPTEAG